MKWVYFIFRFIMINKYKIILGFTINIRKIFYVVKTTIRKLKVSHRIVKRLPRTETEIRLGLPSQCLQVAGNSLHGHIERRLCLRVKGEWNDDTEVFIGCRRHPVAGSGLAIAHVSPLQVETILRRWYLLCFLAWCPVIFRQFRGQAFWFPSLLWFQFPSPLIGIG